MDCLVWFVFEIVFFYQKNCNYGYETALQMAQCDLNKVIIRHNESYYARQEFGYGWHDTSDYTDRQCIFSSLLDNDHVYKKIDAFKL